MWCREVDDEGNRCSFTQEEMEEHKIVLTEEEQFYINAQIQLIYVWASKDIIYNHINSLLLDRFQKWKEAWIDYTKLEL